eukprot:gene13884-15321_t
MLGFLSQSFRRGLQVAGTSKSFGVSVMRPQISRQLVPSQSSFLQSSKPFHSTAIASGKLKNKKAATKRFIVRGSGRVLYKHAGKSHINAHKNHRRLARLGETAELKGTFKKNMFDLLPGNGVSIKR